MKPRQLPRLLASFFYVGFFPLAPGSLATVAGMLIAFILSGNIPFYLFVFILITLTGFFVSDAAEKDCGTKDPAFIVIDEVSGVLIAFFLLPLTPAVCWTAYFLFRAFDMFKIYPVNKFEQMPGGMGIMMDDIIAGIYTNLVMQIAVRAAGLV